jgi:hypothetical protein
MSSTLSFSGRTIGEQPKIKQTKIKQNHYNPNKQTQSRYPRLFLLLPTASLSLSLLPHGYLCDSSRRNVTALDLSGFNLSGALSPDLGVSRSGLCRKGKSSEDRLVDAADADNLFRRNKSDPLIVVVTDCLKEQIMA